MAQRPSRRPDQPIAYLGLNDRNLPSRAEMFSTGKCHAEYIEESDPNVTYLAHEVAGVQEGPGVLTDQALTRSDPCCSFIEYRLHLNILRHRPIFKVQRGPPDFFLNIIDIIRGTCCKMRLHRDIMRLNPYTVGILVNAASNSKGNAKNNPHKLRVGGWWSRAETVKFGIEMIILGRDPYEWFRKDNIDQTVPTCLTEVARVSIQSMILAIEFLRVCVLFRVPAAYKDLGLYFIQRELNFWNIELLLAYIIGGPAPWDGSPRDRQWGTTFEPLLTTVAGIANISLGDMYQASTANTPMLAIVTEFFNNNMPPLANIATPSLASAVLGAIPLVSDNERNSILSLSEGGFLPPIPSEFKHYRCQLATFRLAAALKSISNPSPSVWQDYILPMILVSLPYGLLKLILYEMTNLDLRYRHTLALQVCNWRAERTIQWLKRQANLTGKCILWKRPHWTYDERKAPSLAALPNRYRWIEVPFLIKQLDRQGRVTYIFDFKRYWYGWQEYEGDELQEKNRDIEQTDAWDVSRRRKRVKYMELAEEAEIQEQFTTRRAERRAARETDNGIAG